MSLYREDQLTAIIAFDGNPVAFEPALKPRAHLVVVVADEGGLEVGPALGKDRAETLATITASSIVFCQMHRSTM